jgi:hypothetical protein
MAIDAGSGAISGEDDDVDEEEEFSRNKSGSESNGRCRTAAVLGDLPNSSSCRSSGSQGIDWE